jgi:hypothetical protein
MILSSPTSFWPKLTLGWSYSDVILGSIYFQTNMLHGDEHLNVLATLIITHKHCLTFHILKSFVKLMFSVFVQKCLLYIMETFG